MATPAPGSTTGIFNEALEALCRPAPARPRFDPRVFDALRNRVFHCIEREVWYRYRPGGAPPVRRMRIDCNVELSELEFLFDIYDGQQYSFRTEASREWSLRVLTAVGLEQICTRFWDCCAEAFNGPRFRGDRFDWREDAQLRNMIEDARRGLAPRLTVAEGYATMGVDLADFVDYTTVQIRQAYVIDPSHLVEAPNMTATEVGERTDRYVREWAAQRQAQFTRDLGAYGYAEFEVAGGVDRAEAEARGDKLLREWLSPKERASYDRAKHFEVIGESTGKRYRITHGTVQNVYELDANGRQICGWCFAPAGGLVAGDVMLAQKIALETDERAVLKVANRFGGATYGRSSAYTWFDEIARIDLSPGAINSVRNAVPTEPAPLVRDRDVGPPIDGRSWLANRGAMGRDLLAGIPRDRTSRAARPARR